MNSNWAPPSGAATETDERESMQRDDAHKQRSETSAIEVPHVSETRSKGHAERLRSKASAQATRRD